MFSTPFWLGFLSFVFLALALDLGVLNRKPKIPSFKEAIGFSVLWFLLALFFNIIIYFYAGSEKAMEFAAGYIVELSLSIDNVFVFILLFTYFKVERRYQYRVLFWGIIGAIIMRFAMISGGIYLIKHFEWIFYLFGAFLIFSAYKIMFSAQSSIEPSDNKLIIFLKKFLRVSDEYHGNKFVIVKEGKKYFTPLFIVLILIEKTDLIFAMDSIPAILAITQDSFIVFTSNIFAILGLRSLYFLLADIVDKFVYLKYGLGFILAYIGIKMILVVQNVHIPILLSLGVIFSAIIISIIASFLKTRKIG